ncbi:MAG TPA: hypothetical protein VHM64_12600 [Candidatus Binatia bacterium]|nr:hypothetical protein [Candidatus Binatia bacterium]
MNPVTREGLEVFFAEGHGLPVYFYLLTILAPVQFLALYLPSLDAQMWSGSGNLFKVSSSTALLLMVYFALRVANQEYAPWRFQTLKRWLGEEQLSAGVIAKGQLGFLAAHILCSFLLSAPFLIWAAAIARAPLASVGVTMALLLFYALCYSIWGLVTLVIWERRPESRQVVVRCFLFFLAVATLLIYLPLNPVAYLLATLGHHELAPLTVGGVRWSADTVHFAFHVILGVCGLMAHRWALGRGLSN